MDENVWCVDGKHHGHDKKCLILDPDPYSYLNKIKLNKMELLQSQAPAERELLGDSADRTLDIRV